MCQTNDGFIISEKDLELRGSGDFFGTEQHGIPEFKIANLFEDMGILKKVQKIAMEIMADDPLLEKEKNIKLSGEAIQIPRSKQDTGGKFSLFSIFHKK